MDELERSLSNTKSDEQSRKESFIENEKVEAKTPDKLEEDIAPASSASPLNRSASNHDIDDDDDDNISTDQIAEVTEQFHNVHIPVKQTFPTELPSKTNHTIGSNRDEETERTNITLNDRQNEGQHTSLNEYLNKHERFLKSIDHNRQLSSYERIRLDRHKEDLKRLQEQLAKRLEENSLKNRYEKQKQDDSQRKRNAYLQRRYEEARLKESRKPRVTTTFRLSDQEKRSKSQTNKKDTKFSSSPTKSTVSSVSHYSNHMESQTDTNYFERLDMEHRLDQFDKYYKEHPNEVGQSLRQLITQFVEHSKQSWSRE